MQNEIMENVSVNILSKEYQIACPTHCKEELKASAIYLEEKINAIRNKGKAINFENILITAAINLAYEVVQKNIQHTTENQDLVANLNLLKDKLNTVLHKSSHSNKLLEL